MTDRAWRSRLAVTALAVIVLALAACGGGTSDDSGSTSPPASTAAPAETEAPADTGSATPVTAEAETAADAIAAAAEAVEAARAPLAEFDGPTESPGQVPPDKSIAVIYPLPAPLPSRAAESVVEAAEAVGWTARLIDGQGNPEGYVNAIEQAISSQVDGIVLVAMPVQLLQEQIKQANDAGITVVAALPGTVPPDAPPEEYGLFDYVSPNHYDEGYLLGQWVVQDSPEGAKAIVLTSPEFPDLTEEAEAFEQALVDAGSGFEVVDRAESPVTDILGGPQGVQRIAALIRKNPDAKYLFMLSESWAGIFLQAKETTGATDIAGLGSDGDFTVPAIKEGEKLVMIGPDTLTYGWYAVDALIRAFNGEAPVHYYENMDIQLVDPANAPEVDGEGITATYDFRDAWKTLWGLS